MWLSGDLTALLEEGRSIQHGLTCPHVSNDSSNVSLSFSKLMLQGRVRAALRLLSDHENGFPLQWHIFVILIVSCTSTIVAPSNLIITGSIGMKIYNSP